MNEILTPQFAYPLDSIIAIYDAGLSPFSTDKKYPYNIQSLVDLNAGDIKGLNKLRKLPQIYQSIGLNIEEDPQLQEFFDFRKSDEEEISKPLTDDIKPNIDHPLSWNEFRSQLGKSSWLEELENKARERLIYELRNGIHPLYPGRNFSYRELSGFFNISFQRIAIINKETQDRIDTLLD